MQPIDAYLKVAAIAKQNDSADKRRCNICGGDEFLTGPGGRLSATGLKPRCAKCQNLERHRTLRRVYDRLRGRLPLAGLSCLQISKDRCIEPSWFASHATSIYEAQHSLDIQRLSLASRAFDCVICNHVLEHVPDDSAGIAELIRVTSDRGFLQIGVPDPMRIRRTDDWGYPRWEDHGHFRKYGIDIVEKLKGLLDGAKLVRVVESDPVTEMQDMYFFITRAPDVVAALIALYPDAVIEGAAEVSGAHARDSHPLLLASQFMRDPKRLLAYVVDKGHEDVQGWVTLGALSAILAFDSLQRRLGINGHVCEIGVHHGRLFLALSMLRRLGERSLAIDVFDLQEFNVDNSGKGDREVFEHNVERWLAPDADVIIKQSDSLSIDADAVISALGGKVRLFSVDGSHTCEHTLNDIRVAEGALVEGGLVIVDDFLNPDWPGVVEAVMRYLDNERPGGLEPIGYGQNKFYLTTRGRAKDYLDCMRFWSQRRHHSWKDVLLCGKPIAHFSLPPADQFLRQTPVPPAAPLSASADGSSPLVFLGAPVVREKNGAWLHGVWSGIALDMSLLSKDTPIRLVITASLFRHARIPQPRVEVYAFGRQVGVIEGDNTVLHTTIEIDPRLAGPSDRLELWFKCEQALSPMELGISNDDRSLSVLLMSIQLAVSVSKDHPGAGFEGACA